MSVGSRPFLMHVSLLVLASIMCPSIALACKDRIYPTSFPVAELQAYKHVYVIRVDQLTYAIPSGEVRYAAPFTFEGKVIQVIKGTKVAGDVIRGATATGEEAHARCPISLESGKAYLLMLNGSGLNYTLPRYGSLYVASDRPEFKTYLADLTKKSR